MGHQRESHTFGDLRPVRLTVERFGDGFEATFEPLRPESVPPSLRRFSMALRVRHPARLSVSGFTRPAWGMAAGFWRGEKVFRDATRWAHRLMFPKRDERATAEMRAFATTEMQRLYEVLRDLLVSAARACDPEARRIAMRFGKHLRFDLYRNLLADTTGRLAQAATVCPGAIIFSAAMCEGTLAAAAAGNKLLGDLIAGRRLNDALDDALVAWQSEAAFHAGKAMGDRRKARQRRDSDRDVWLHLMTQDEACRARTQRAQRLLIRRAGSLVPTTLLRLPPPLVFAPEDIPTAVRANATWYRVMKAHPRLLGARYDNPRESEEAHALGEFLSRHAVETGRLAALPPGPWIESLFDFIRATGRRPTRDTDPAQLVSESDRWHIQMGRVRGLDDLGMLTPASRDALCGDPDHPFPAPPLGAFAFDDIVARPLRTPRELIDEGCRQHNCVASHLSEAAIGQAFFYSVTLAGKPVTVQIENRNGAPEIIEAKGSCNRTLRPQEWAALASWLEAASCASESQRRPGDPLESHGEQEVLGLG